MEIIEAIHQYIDRLRIYIKFEIFYSQEKINNHINYILFEYLYNKCYNIVVKFNHNTFITKYDFHYDYKIFLITENFFNIKLMHYFFLKDNNAGLVEFKKNFTKILRNYKKLQFLQIEFEEETSDYTHHRIIPYDQKHFLSKIIKYIIRYIPFIYIKYERDKSIYVDDDIKFNKNNVKHILDAIKHKYNNIIKFKNIYYEECNTSDNFICKDTINFWTSITGVLHYEKHTFYNELLYYFIFFLIL